MSDYQSEVRKLLDFTEDVLTNLLNIKDASQQLMLQRAMLEVELRRSSRDHSKFQQLIKRRLLHKAPLDIVKREVMEYDDILPFQRLSNCFRYYTDADEMDQIEFNRRIDSYIKNSQDHWLINEERTKNRTVNRIDTSSKGGSLQNKFNAINNNLSNVQKSQDVSVSINHANTTEHKTFPTTPVGGKPLKIVKRKVEIKDNEVKTSNPILIQRRVKPVVSPADIVKSDNQISNTSVSHATENKTNRIMGKEDNCIERNNEGSNKLSSDKKSSFNNDNGKENGKIDTSKNNKMDESLIELESRGIINISSELGSSDNVVEMEQSTNGMEEVVKPQNKILKSSDKITNKNFNGKEKNKIFVKDKDIKKYEEKQQAYKTSIKTNYKIASNSSIQEVEKSINTTNVDKNPVDKSSNKIENKKLTNKFKIIFKNNSNKSKIGDKRRLETKDKPGIHKKSKINTRMNNKTNNQNKYKNINRNKNKNKNKNPVINNKKDHLIECIQNSKITLETLLGFMTPVSNGATFEQFHKVEPPSPKVFEKENKNKDGNSIRLIQLFDSITKSEEPNENSSSDSLKEETLINDSRQLNNNINSGNNGKVNTIWNNVTNDENRREDVIPLNQSTSNVDKSMYDRHVSTHEDGLPFPKTINNLSDNDFKSKSILFEGHINKNGSLTKNPFITSHPKNKRKNLSASAKPAKYVVNKKVPKALKKMSDLVSRYNLDD